MAASNPPKNDTLPSGSTPTSSGIVSMDPLARIQLSKIKLAVEVFDCTGHFDVWQGEVLDSLFQQGHYAVVIPICSRRNQSQPR
ncbi:hypothetical protein PIB30_017837 [Stylosanthes scabra]|uniref:Uncharacterized protein n=1 Tax=Stylosanthes scabra TaxID=79078 RepID=A0ABU6W6B7_9FABA|nr:hypothetical protein [Stylosanthes scabra]